MNKGQILFREGLINCWCDSFPNCPNQTSQNTIEQRWKLRQTTKQKTYKEVLDTTYTSNNRKYETPPDIEILNEHIRKVLGL